MRKPLTGSDGDKAVVPIHMLLATSAKVLCSALFVSHRDEEEALLHSAFHALQVHHLPETMSALARAHVNREAHEVTMQIRIDDDAARQLVDAYRRLHPDFDTDWEAERRRLASLGTVSRTASFVGSQGSVILPQDGSNLRFVPEPVTSALPPADDLPWPMGDRLEGFETIRGGANRQSIEHALEEAFADANAHTAAVVVVHRGAIVGERYRNGFGIDTQFESWSMGKSITATLIGLLVGAGLLQLDDPAPIDAWRTPGDPRNVITIRHLLNMSGGLRCSGPDDPRSQWRYGLPDHFRVYGDAFDTFAFAIDRPAQFAPGTVGRYRNCDTLALGAILRRTVTETLGQSYLRWPQAALFDRIGIRSQVLETDVFGNFVMTGFDYGTARNWARLGLLYLQDGVWQGERVLPAGWVDFVRTPAPGWPDRNYGGQFWLNTRSEFSLPTDTYSMYGGGEQRVFIVPSADLVIVRMGHQAGHTVAKKSVDRLVQRVFHAVAN